MDGLQWLGTVAGSILGLLGIAKIVEMSLSRFWKGRDDKKALHDSITNKQIDADTAFLQSILNRLEKLEAEHKEMQDKLLTQAVNNAKLDTENKHLKETNERQEGEIDTLRREKNEQAKKIHTLESDLQKTQEEVKNLQKQIGSLMYELGQTKDRQSRSEH